MNRIKTLMKVPAVIAAPPPSDPDAANAQAQVLGQTLVTVGMMGTSGLVAQGIGGVTFGELMTAVFTLEALPALGATGMVTAFAINAVATTATFAVAAEIGIGAGSIAGAAYDTYFGADSGADGNDDFP